MALQLPANFKQDIQSRDTSLIPLVRLGNAEGTDEQLIFISTNTVTIDTDTFLPLLLNVPSLKESIDVEKRNYKISSVNIELSNFPYNGKRLSELISELQGSLINVECRIWWASPSGNIPYLSGDNDNGALMIYSGKIRRYNMTGDKISLVVEDDSQASLHKDLPTQYLGTSDDIVDKYKNVAVPICYGAVDRSPCVMDAGNVIKADSQTLKNTLGLYIDRDETYLEVPDDIVYPFDSHNQLEGSADSTKQWLLNPDSNYILQNTVLLQNQLIQAQYKGVPKNIAIRIHDPDYYTVSPLAAGYNFLTDADLKLITSNNTYNSGEINIVSTGTSGDNAAKHTAQPIPPFSMGCTYLEMSHGLGIDSENEILVGATVNGLELPGYLVSEEGLFNALKGTGVTLYKGMANSGENWEDDHYGVATQYRDLDGTDGGLTGLNMYDLFYIAYYEDNSDNTGIPYETGTFGNPNAAFQSLGWNTGSPTQHSFSKFVLHITNGMYRIYIGFSHLSDDYVTESKSQEAYSLSSLSVNTVFDIKNPLKENYYADVEGRYETGENLVRADKIIMHILKDELGAVNTLDTGFADNDWRYAFSVNKKIGAKKLIQGIASASPYIPRFNNANDFILSEIPSSGGGFHSSPGDQWQSPVLEDNQLILEDDVLDFSFSRTDISEVFTRIDFRFNFDYARGEFTKRRWMSMDTYACPDENQPIDPQYNYSYYGFDSGANHLNTTLVIDDDRGKYIRDDDTAERFVTWMLGWYGQQHLQMKIKLPLKYMNLEIGDIIKIGDNGVLAGVKPYGIDYTTILSGDNNPVCHYQMFYPTFIITSTNKTLEWVQIEATQLHRLHALDWLETQITPDGEMEGTWVPGSTPGCDGSAGCNQQQACNYDPSVAFDDGSCIFPTVWCFDEDGDGTGDHTYGMQPVCNDEDIGVAGVPAGAESSTEAADGGFVNDCSDECEGVMDCAGDCNGYAFVNECGDCSLAECYEGCNGEWYEDAGGGSVPVIDECDVCSGGDTGISMCFGIGGVPVGSPSNWAGCHQCCDGVLQCSEDDCENKYDDCGVCGGDGDTCEMNVKLNYWRLWTGISPDGNPYTNITSRWNPSDGTILDSQIAFSPPNTDWNWSHYTPLGTTNLQVLLSTMAEATEGGADYSYITNLLTVQGNYLNNPNNQNIDFSVTIKTVVIRTLTVINEDGSLEVDRLCETIKDEELDYNIFAKPSDGQRTHIHTSSISHSEYLLGIQGQMGYENEYLWHISGINPDNPIFKMYLLEYDYESGDIKYLDGTKRFDIQLDVTVTLESIQGSTADGATDFPHDLGNITVQNLDNPTQTFLISHHPYANTDTCSGILGDIKDDGSGIIDDYDYLAASYYTPGWQNFGDCYPDSDHWDSDPGNVSVYCCRAALLSTPLDTITANDLVEIVNCIGNPLCGQ